MRKHLSYANVVATLALLFAMSGGALAAGHYLINSTKQINPKVVKKLRGNTGKRGPAGPLGVAGSRGPTGPEGQSGPPGPMGQDRAYAVITPGKPATIHAGSRGVISAESFSGEGTTCVILEPSIDLEEIAPVVTSLHNDVTFAALPDGCSVDSTWGVEVIAYNPNETRNETDGFSIVIP